MIAASEISIEETGIGNDPVVARAVIPGTEEGEIGIMMIVVTDKLLDLSEFSVESLAHHCDFFFWKKFAGHRKILGDRGNSHYRGSHSNHYEPRVAEPSSTIVVKGLAAHTTESTVHHFLQSRLAPCSHFIYFQHPH